MGNPPSATQAVGTANIIGSDVIVVQAPPNAAPSGKWVQITRNPNPTTTPGFQGVLTRQAGDGVYTFSATLYMPTDTTGPTSLSFDAGSQGNFAGFLHLDFMADDTIRVDDGQNSSAAPSRAANPSASRSR